MASCLRSGKAFKRSNDCPDEPIVKQCRFKLSDTVDKDEEGDSIQMDHKDVSGLSLEFDPEEQIKPPIRSLLGPLLTGTSVVPSNRRNLVYSSLEESSAEIAPTNGLSDESDKENIFNFELDSTAPIFVIHNTHGQQYPLIPTEDFDHELCKSLADWLAEHTTLQEEYVRRESTFTVRPQTDPCCEPINNQTVDLPDCGQVLSPSPPTIASPNQTGQLIDSVENDRSPTESTSPEMDNSNPVDSIQTEELLPIPSSSEAIQTISEHFLVSDNQIDHSVGAVHDHQTTAKKNTQICLPPNFFPHRKVEPVRVNSIMPPMDTNDDLLAFAVEKSLQAFNRRLNTVNPSSVQTVYCKNKVVDFLLASKDILETIADRQEDRKKQITVRCVGFFSYRSSWLKDETKARLDAHSKVFDFLAELSSTVDTCKKTIATLWTKAAAAGSVLATDVIKEAFPIIKEKHPKMFKYIGASQVYLTNIKKFDKADLSINVKNMLSLLYSLSNQ